MWEGFIEGLTISITTGVLVVIIKDIFSIKRTPIFDVLMTVIIALILIYLVGR